MLDEVINVACRAYDWVEIITDVLKKRVGEPPEVRGIDSVPSFPQKRNTAVLMGAAHQKWFPSMMMRKADVRSVLAYF